MNAPTYIDFSVENDITTEDSSNVCIRLRGKDSGVSTSAASRLEILGGISEELAGNFATNLGATPSFDCSQSTCFCGIANVNITQINVTGVDSSSNRVTTLQLYLSCGAARTIADSISINGASAQDLDGLVIKLVLVVLQALLQPTIYLLLLYLSLIHI